MASVAFVCVAALVMQWADLAQRRWRAEFDAAQKPLIELAKLKSDIESRLLDLEKRATGAALKSMTGRG